ncbi:hypothetical protein EDC01DRAFT_632655 [Geopyxis carbonaria]|nr:hypothetical protein EDC01DRAFT_632655 [Geopyxis carbonaria]
MATWSSTPRCDECTTELTPEDGAHETHCKLCKADLFVLEVCQSVYFMEERCAAERCSAVQSRQSIADRKKAAEERREKEKEFLRSAAFDITSNPLPLGRSTTSSNPPLIRNTINPTATLLSTPPCDECTTELTPEEFAKWDYAHKVQYTPKRLCKLCEDALFALKDHERHIMPERCKEERCLAEKHRQGIADRKKAAEEQKKKLPRLAEQKKKLRRLAPFDYTRS